MARCTIGASGVDENASIGSINKDEETTEYCGTDENGDTIEAMKKTKTKVSSARRSRQGQS